MTDSPSSEQFLFLREAQPNRTHTKGIDRSDKTRVCTTALIMRGCVIGSSREVYEKVPPNGFDRESWQRFWDEVEAIPIPTNGQRVKIGDPHSYGSWTNINASHASSYFDNVNLLVTKLSGQGSPLPFSTVYNWLLKEKLKGGKRPFPNAAGPLIGGLLTCKAVPVAQRQIRLTILMDQLILPTPDFARCLRLKK